MFTHRSLHIFESRKRNQLRKLTILSIIGLDFLYLNFWNSVITRDVLLVIFLSLTLSYLSLERKTYSHLYIWRYKRYVYYTWILAFISSFSPSIKCDQNFFLTLIAQRSLLCMTFFLFLLKLSPTEEIIIRLLKTISVLAILSGIISIFYPHWFTDDIGTAFILAQRKQGTIELISTLNGAILLTLFYFYCCQNLIEKGTWKNMMMVIVLIVYLIILQNRSTLLVALPVFFYSVLKMKSKYKIQILITMSFLIIITLIPFALKIISQLTEETQSQLTSDSYNRWQAMDFFFFERNYNLCDVFWGHGVPASGSSYLKELLEASEERWAFISDLGMLGTFFYYGLFFVLVFYIPFIFRVLFNRYYPFYLKTFALWILIVPTYHGYNLPGTISNSFIYCMYMYLVILYDYKNRIRKI